MKKRSKKPFVAPSDSDTQPCTKCKSPINWIDVFPGGVCISCHEKKFNAEVAKNGGVLPRPNFGGCVN